MILKDRNNHDIKIKVLQWVTLPFLNPVTNREEETIFAVGLDQNGEIERYRIDNLVGEKNFKEVK